MLTLTAKIPPHLGKFPLPLRSGGCAGQSENSAALDHTRGLKQPVTHHWQPLVSMHCPQLLPLDMDGIWMATKNPRVDFSYL